MKRLLFIVSVVSLALTAPSATAGIVNLTATLDGAQANAGAGSGALGTGTANMTLDTDTNLLTWNISWAGLSGPVTAMHFHGAANPNQNAAVQIDIGAVSGLNTPSIGNLIVADQQEADLLAGLWYINIHTAQFPPGEIRGQVLVEQGDSVPAPAAGLLMIMGVLLLIASRTLPRTIFRTHNKKS